VRPAITENRRARLYVVAESRAMERAPCVYILASKSGVLYTGVTSNLAARLTQHKLGGKLGFTTRYNVNRLVWFEPHGNMFSAIAREKEIKSWTRAKKVALIEAKNPEWRDLAEG
jgi:putative endonuclease